jgi:hypothetical protein
MKTKIYAIVVTILFVVSFGFNTVLTLQNVNFNNQLAQLGNKLFVAESKIQMYETLEKKDRQNDINIYLEDPKNFVADGIISLGEQAVAVDTIQVTLEDGSKSVEYRYRLDGVPGFLTKSGEWVRINADKGETVHPDDFNRR